jgi:hypothetical protein
LTDATDVIDFFSIFVFFVCGLAICCGLDLELKI